LAIEIELRGLANLGRQNALNLRHVRARGEGADGQNLGDRRLRHHGRTFLKRVGFGGSASPSRPRARAPRSGRGDSSAPPRSQAIRFGALPFFFSQTSTLGSSQAIQTGLPLRLPSWSV